MAKNETNNQPLIRLRKLEAILSENNQPAEEAPLETEVVPAADNEDLNK